MSRSFSSASGFEGCAAFGLDDLEVFVIRVWTLGRGFWICFGAHDIDCTGKL